METMDIDIPDGSDQSVEQIKENGFHLYPVSANDSGEGLPYAPKDWPNPGDNWSWKVGRRIAHSGYFVDRYLYLPMRLRVDSKGRKRGGFASKLSVEQFVREEFPAADIDAFFASFSWKIPSIKLCEIEDHYVPPRQLADNLGSDSQSGVGGCKAGNKLCSSLLGPTDSPSETMVCDLCCSEPGFCQSCCCILCCKSINFARERNSFIKCQAVVDVEGAGFICGHFAHIECGLRSYMAGTVGGSIGLDAQYYCRRCDTKTDLVPHVEKLLENCQSYKSRVDVEKILNTGVSVLRGSKKPSAKMLLHRIESAMAKLKSGTCLDDVWEMEEATLPAGALFEHDIAPEEVLYHDQEPPLDIATCDGSFDHHIESLKLEDEIDQVLQALRKSQETEYRIAEETLSSQKNYIVNLYQQLDKEKSELSRRTTTTTTTKTYPDAVAVTKKRADQIKREVMKLKDMELVAKGFGKTPLNVLREHFSLGFED